MPKASVERRERAANEMRKIILDAAEHLLVEGGPEEVTIRKIASRLDYAPPSLYYYVADKDAVLAGLADRHGAQIGQAMRDGVDSSCREPLAALRSMCHAYLDWAKANPAFYLVLFRYRSEKGPTDVALMLFDLFAEPVAHAQKQGRIRRDSHPRHIAHTIWSAVHGLAHFQITQPGLIDMNPAAATFQIEAILRGLRGP